MDISKIADRLEAFAGCQWGILTFAAWCLFVPMLSVDVSNYGISVYTTVILVIGIRTNRAERKATQAKLDALVHSAKDVDDKLMRAEDLDEQTIEEIREDRD